MTVPVETDMCVLVLADKWLEILTCEGRLRLLVMMIDFDD